MRAAPRPIALRTEPMRSTIKNHRNVTLIDKGDGVRVTFCRHRYVGDPVFYFDEHCSLLCRLANHHVSIAELANIRSGFYDLDLFQERNSAASSKSAKQRILFTPTPTGSMIAVIVAPYFWLA
jgi:hypothetical protein